MMQNLTVFEAAALADCRRDGIRGYQAGTFAEITGRHGVELDRLCELWDSERKLMASRSNIIPLRGRALMLVFMNTPDRKWLAIAAATSAIEAAAVLSRMGHEDSEPDDHFSDEVVMKLIDALKMSIEAMPAEAACTFSSLLHDLKHELEYWA